MTLVLKIQDDRVFPLYHKLLTLFFLPTVLCPHSFSELTAENVDISNNVLKCHWERKNKKDKTRRHAAALQRKPLNNQTKYSLACTFHF